jgi:transposase
LGDVTGARILAEMGDDRARFADARAIKAYAGSAPITRASGRSLSVTHRRIKNGRFAAAGWVWAFCSITHNEHARAHYQRRRDHGDRHSSALRHLFNRQLGQLWRCLQTDHVYNPERAFTREARSILEPAAT